MNFLSKYERLGEVAFPEFSGIRIMMMPFLIHDPESIPNSLQHWAPTVNRLCEYATEKHGVGYLTIDEQNLLPGRSQRRPGLHVDGVDEQGKLRASYGGGGGGGAYGSSGMILAASRSGCRAWRQTFEGWPGADGDCEHLREQCGPGEVFEGGVAYWCDGLCVHESIPNTGGERQLVRLSMPSECPWHEGYTKNPKGVLPTGPILSRRKYQTEDEVILN